MIGSRPQGERVRVTLWGSLRSAAEGRDTVEIEAAGRPPKTVAATLGESVNLGEIRV